MAFIARLGALTDELVTLVTSTSSESDPDRFNVFREAALRSLKNTNLPRTNQFEVADHLRGLVERFAVVGRDGLSDALKRRLDVLSDHATKWTPEILNLLLELSDQPTHKSRLSDLELLREPPEEPEPRLRWEDVAKEDGWKNDPDLWRNVDFADSSEDETFDDVRSEISSASDHTSASSIVPQQQTAQDLAIARSDDSELRVIEETQTWRHATQPKDAAGRPLKIPLSEFQVLRETLFMLHGLHCDLFGKDCTPLPKYQLANVSWNTYRALINDIAEHGRTLLPLRQFSKSTLDIPLLQAFQQCVCQALRHLDQQVASIQARFLDIKQDVVVSLVAVLEELKPSLAPMSPLSGIIRQLQEEPYAHAFRFLELLYDATCIAHLKGDDATYRFLGTMFFDCFRVYVRPIRQWMEEGELTSGDKTFFVSESTVSVPLHQVWGEKFRLLRTQDGTLHAPRFLQPSVKKIFNAGKSIIVLRHLGRFPVAQEHRVSSREPPLDLEAVCPPDKNLAPFSELFSSAFDLWIQSKHHTTSATLQKILFGPCGLWSSLDALQHIFFMSDGSLSESFTSAVFSNLDDLNSNWSDRFALTEAAQEAWAPCLDAHRISAVADAQGSSQVDNILARSSVKHSLPLIRLAYRLAWPVQLVIAKESIEKYQDVFTLLLQLRRATSTLTYTIRLIDPSSSAPGDSDEQAVYFGLRTNLLWFYNTLHTYLTTIVLIPEIACMRADLEAADDVDAMISVHSAFVGHILSQACLGRRLQPIHECILDVLDLSIRLEDARRGEVARQQDEMSRLSANRETPSYYMSATPRRRGVYVSPREKVREEETTMIFGDDFAAAGEIGGRAEYPSVQTYGEVLAGIRSDFDRQLRFVAGGLRGVARATSDAAAAKWDTLAEMLEMGSSRDHHRR